MFGICLIHSPGTQAEARCIDTGKLTNNMALTFTFDII